MAFDCTLAARGMLGDNPDVKAITVRLSDQGEARLNRLLKMTSKGTKEIVEDALAHYLGTIESRQPVYVVPPSEVTEPESD